MLPSRTLTRCDVRVSRRALLMLDRVRMLAANVLNQRAAARNVQRLETKANRKHRHGALFRFGQRQQIRGVLFRVDISQSVDGGSWP